MSIRRVCDHDDCVDDALFMVGLYGEDDGVLEDTRDVCGSEHMRAVLKEWLKYLADIEEAS